MTNTVLTDEQKDRFVSDICEYGTGFVVPLYSVVEAIEQAVLQSQVKNDKTLFCDLKTDEEKSSFFLTGRGYETGVIAHSIQNDVAMAYHRCSEYRKELEALQAENERLRCIIRDLKDWDCDVRGGFLSIPVDLRRRMQEAIDPARRIEGDS